MWCLPIGEDIVGLVMKLVERAEVPFDCHLHVITYFYLVLVVSSLFISEFEDVTVPLLQILLLLVGILLPLHLLLRLNSVRILIASLFLLLWTLK